MRLMRVVVGVHGRPPRDGDSPAAKTSVPQCVSQSAPDAASACVTCTVRRLHIPSTRDDEPHEAVTIWDQRQCLPRVVGRGVSTRRSSLDVSVELRDVRVHGNVGEGSASEEQTNRQCVANLQRRGIAQGHELDLVVRDASERPRPVVANLHERLGILGVAARDAVATLQKPFSVHATQSGSGAFRLEVASESGSRLAYATRAQRDRDHVLTGGTWTVSQEE